jgi:type I restriction enzyme M protein
VGRGIPGGAGQLQWRPLYAQFAENHRFQIPQGAHWNDVRQAPKNVGAAIQKAMRAIETANPDLLDGIFGDAPGPTASACPTKR